MTEKGKVSFKPSRLVWWVLLLPPYLGISIYLLLPADFNDLIAFVAINFTAIAQVINIVLLIRFHVSIALSKKSYQVSEKENKQFIVEKSKTIDSKQNNLQRDLNSLDREFRKIAEEHIRMSAYVELLLKIYTPQTPKNNGEFNINTDPEGKEDNPHTTD